MSHKHNHHDRETGVPIRVAEDPAEGSAEPGRATAESDRAPEPRYLPGDLVTELRRQYVVQLDVPGVDPDDIAIDLTGQQLTVDGRRAEPSDKGARLHASRVGGGFHYCLDLPGPVRSRRASSRLHRGVLTIILPKNDPAGPRRIKID